jgi:hypothetical protein
LVSCLQRENVQLKIFTQREEGGHERRAGSFVFLSVIASGYL